MSKKANPTIIGAFVIGALTLTVLSLILIGGGKVFDEKQVYVTYFEDSLQGLRVGANVTLRGVRIGQVSELYVRFDESTLAFDSPVLIELDGKAIRTVVGEKYDRTEYKDLVNLLIEKGMRAQLELESMVTGQLLVDLDYHSDTVPVFRGAGDGYLEIPTVQNDIQRVLKSVQTFAARLDGFPIEKFMANLAQSIEGIKNFATSPGLTSTVNGIDKLVNSEELQQLSVTLHRSIEKFDFAMLEMGNALKNINQRVDPLAGNANKTMRAIETAVLEIQSTSNELRNLMGDETVRHELTTALKEITNAARSVRVSVEYLERHPESFLSGKPESP